MTIGKPGSRTDDTLERDALVIPGDRLHRLVRGGIDTLSATGLCSAQEEQLVESFLADYDGSFGWGLLRYVAETKTTPAASPN